MSEGKVKVQALLLVGVLVCASIAILGVFSTLPTAGKYTYALNHFQSYDELLGFLKQRASSYGSTYLANALKDSTAGRGSSELGSESPQAPVPHSSTNVQVAGVDEPDTVKTDGTYIYTISNNSLFILRAYPVTEANIVAKISFDMNNSVQSFFINGDRLVAFCSGYAYPILYYGGGVRAMESDLIYPGWYSTQMQIRVYDISDRSNPALVKSLKMDGYFLDARMIGSYVYVVSSTPTYSIYTAVDGNETLRVPTITIDNKTTNISADNIYYVDVPELADSMTHVLSLNIDTNDVNEKSFMLGSSQTMYVSQDNIYLATSHYPAYSPLDMTAGTTTETTILHKIAISQDSIDYVAQGEVPGHILNQFAMDEHQGYFRIATTTDYYKGEEYQTTNNVYVLTSDLKRAGTLENLAPGESIYAVRFLGDRAYLVTFVQVDPLFVLDLSDPTNPSVLGELKIPGYSTYLHPYDATHIIGIGREVDRSIDADKVHTPGAVYYTAIQGLKFALFDVTDVANPVELYTIALGDRGTDSPALYDHHAFLFDHDTGLLVIPVSLWEIPQTTLDTLNDSNATEIAWDWGQYTFQGAYVYRLTIDDGFQLQGRITHRDTNDPVDSWSYGVSTDVTRSLYIGDTLYTISTSKIKANSLAAGDDLQELASITLA